MTSIKEMPGLDEEAIVRWRNWEINGWGTRLDPEAAEARDQVFLLREQILAGARIELPLAAVQALNAIDDFEII